MYGKIWQEWWKWLEQKISPKYDFYFGGGIIKSVLPSDEFVISENLTPYNYYHSGKTAEIMHRENVIGQFGVLKPSITEDMKDDVVYFEIDLESIEKVCVDIHPTYKAFSKQPVVKRDISITADKTLQLAKIEKVIKDIMKTGFILKEYSLVSVYADEAKLGAGKISYSFRLSYKSDNKTLTDEEVNNDINTLLQKLKAQLGVKLRQ